MCAYVCILYIYLCPSRPVLRATTFRNLISNFLAALPCISRTISTISINVRRMALMNLSMMPRSIVCIPSPHRASASGAHRSWRSAKMFLKTRCAPHLCRASSFCVHILTNICIFLHIYAYFTGPIPSLFQSSKCYNRFV